MRLLDEHDLTAKHIRPFSRAQRWRLIQDGKFPKPLKIGTRNFWPEQEIDAWQAELVAAAIAQRDQELVQK
jgi:predicted DNA-binding transcriptional regulator AlpA